MKSVVHVLRREEALRFLDERSSVVDAPGNPRNPFATTVWTRHFIEQIVSSSSAVVAVEGRNNGSALMMLLREDRSPGRLKALTNYYSSLYTPLWSMGVERKHAIDALGEGLRAVRPAVATVDLGPLDATAPDTEDFTRTLTNQGWYVRRYSCFGNWYLPCAGLNFESYWQSRDSQLRNTYQRKAKKLLAAGSVDIVTKPEEVDAAMDAYDAVYAKSWKKREPYADFVRGWARQCADRGWLRLGVARLDGRPIAAQFWFTIEKHAYIFKLAYDEAESKWSAGTILTAHLFRQALDGDQVVEVDYLTGDDPYKKVWMTNRRERVGLMACNLRNVRGLLAATREWAGEARARMRRQSVLHGG